jgi:plasmid stability protein
MSRSITIRDVPDETGDELVSRAAATGRSLQEYLRTMLIEAGEPTGSRTFSWPASGSGRHGRGATCVPTRSSSCATRIGNDRGHRRQRGGLRAGGRGSGRALVGTVAARPVRSPRLTSCRWRRRTSCGAAALRGDISEDAASLAHADLGDLRLELFPYEVVAARAWELRANLTMYDACCVALAELLDADLVTLDARLARASGPACGFRVYGE